VGPARDWKKAKSRKVGKRPIVGTEGANCGVRAIRGVTACARGAASGRQSPGLTPQHGLRTKFQLIKIEKKKAR